MTTIESIDVPRATTRLSRGRRSMVVREALTGYLFIAPNLALMSVFLFFPLGWAIVLSFQDATSFGPAVWIGLENYATLLSDSQFWRVLVNTVVFTVATVPVGMLIGLTLANLLNQAMPARGLLRTAIYLPIVISGLVTSLIGLLLFDQRIGIVNAILQAAGLGGLSWQTSGPLAMTSIILMTLWTRVGFAMVIYLAGLQDIPAEMYEAARIDGASGWQQFWRITVPMLSPSTLFLLVMNVIASFQIFDLVYVMTNGGPGNSTEMLVTYAYDKGFGPSREYGYGATLGVVLFVLTLVFTAIQLRLRRRAEA